MNVKVSIIIPIYNVEKYLDRCMQSLLNQTLKDIEIIQEGGSTFRFLTGDYGSGKTFLLQTIKEHVMAKGFVVADTDLSPERSLVGTGNKKKGLAKRLLAELWKGWDKEK